jgi:hypothetical protein
MMIPINSFAKLNIKKFDGKITRACSNFGR